MYYPITSGLYVRRRASNKIIETGEFVWNSVGVLLQTVNLYVSILSRLNFNVSTLKLNVLFGGW